MWAYVYECVIAMSTLFEIRVTLWLFVDVCVRLADLWASKVSVSTSPKVSVSTSPLSVGTLGLHTQATMSRFMWPLGILIQIHRLLPCPLTISLS